MPLNRPSTPLLAYSPQLVPDWVWTLEEVPFAPSKCLDCLTSLSDLLKIGDIRLLSRLSLLVSFHQSACDRAVMDALPRHGRPFPDRHWTER